MPFLLGLLKNPRILAWGLALTIMTGLFTYGKIQYVQVKALKSDLAVAEQNITTLELSNEAKDAKYSQLERDMNAKQVILDGITQDKELLVIEYKTLESQLSKILADIEVGDVETLPEVKKRVEKSVVNSYLCIELATGNVGASCER